MLRILGGRSIKMQLDIHTAFIDYEKAFDRVKHEILMKDLKMLGIDEKDLRLLNNLHKEQLAEISINGKLSNWAHITEESGRGVYYHQIYSQFMLLKRSCSK